MDTQKGLIMATIGDDPVWFITGCSTGFGRELASRILKSGRRAVVTARDPESIQDIVAPYRETALALSLDVTQADQIGACVQAALRRFGRIDVLVNNAGYGYLGAIEEGTEADYRAMFETNMFGPIALMRAVLPGMRERGRGHIVNMSSIVGFVGLPSSCFYAGAKFALEGISEALTADLKPLGVSVTIVEPGSFRTDFAGRSIRTPRESIADYAQTAGATVAYLQSVSGNEPGDPGRAADAIIAAVTSAEPPARLLLGTDALNMARMKLDTLKSTFDRWADVSLSTDYPAPVTS